MTDFATIQQQHRQLFDLFLERRERINEKDINTLLDEIVRQSAQVKAVEEYTWLRDAIDQWRRAGTILHIDLNRSLGIPDPAQPLMAPPMFTVWLDTDLRRRMEFQANEFARRRAVQWRDSLSEEEVFHHYLKTLSPGCAHKESQDDWRQAEMHFANSVLDGSMDLRQITGASYWRVEGYEGKMWLQDVKKLRAYYQWQARKGGWGQLDADRDYYYACEELRGFLFDPQRKLNQMAFEPVEEHLREHFLNAERELDSDKVRVKLWTNVKAARRDMRSAQSFMNLYYNNILRAIVEKDKDATVAVIKALGLSDSAENYDPLVNCFEMLVGIDFLDVEVLLRCA